SLVVDPVMIATSGDVLLDEGAEETLRSRLLPLAALVTPNLPEASRLAGFPVGDVPSMEAAARRLVGLGAGAALVKGGHGSDPTVTDLFFDGSEVRLFRHRRLATANTHGTGCTLSAAIAAELAAGLPLPKAVERGLAYLQLALRHGFRPGRGAGPVGHAVVPSWLEA
ncbi:MAG: hydroxymethylpyrimidine/phosphomethylpyrimidine kinase, partial [Synergistales bacterium]|nr:hydroxymethylpyrimidine/phosphomethylpyrimidine kinase [Synergistales bacterium]